MWSSVSQILSPWQNTDAALLSTISYPAFAVDDDALYSQTLDKIVRKLRGKYGFKRFIRDGYRTANEDKNRRYYKPAEMKVSFSNSFSLLLQLLIVDKMPGLLKVLKAARKILTLCSLLKV